MRSCDSDGQNKAKRSHARLPPRRQDCQAATLDLIPMSRREERLLRQHVSMICGCAPWSQVVVPRSLSRTLLAVLTVFLARVWILITLVPARPSRMKAMRMLPNTRRNVCARRNRPRSPRALRPSCGPAWETVTRQVCTGTQEVRSTSSARAVVRHNLPLPERPHIFVD
jgi:hypothetical protein